jgi:septin 7
MPNDPRPLPYRASVLVTTLCLPPRPLRAGLTNFSLDIEENGVRLRLTVVDTPGFGDFVNNDDRQVNLSNQSFLALRDVFHSSWKPIVENIEARFDSYLEQENRVNRLKLVDNRVHACLYFIQPTGHAWV